MSYDPALVERIRGVVADRAGVTEQRMFGGVGFMLDGNMFVGVMSKGGMLVRVGAGGHEAARTAPHAAPFEVSGRAMAGYVIVAPPGVATTGAVASWIERAWAHVRTLGPKISRGGAKKKVAQKRSPAKKASGKAAARVAPKKTKR